MKRAFFLIILIVLLIISNIFTGFLLLKKEETVKQDESEYSGLEETLEILKEDLDFYKNLDVYFNLLNYEDSEYMEKIEERLDEEELENKFILFALSEVFKDERSKDIINNLKNLVYSNRLTEEAKEELFSKNNACAELVPGIKEQLEDKFKSSYNVSEKEEFEFIFYSPSIKSCLYSTQYDYSNSVGDYYSKTSKIVYNASTQSKIDEFTVSVYNHPYMEEDVTKKGKKDYARFILENSGYNADLLKDVSYIY